MLVSQEKYKKTFLGSTIVVVWLLQREKGLWEKKTSIILCVCPPELHTITSTIPWLQLDASWNAISTLMPEKTQKLQAYLQAQITLNWIHHVMPDIQVVCKIQIGVQSTKYSWEWGGAARLNGSPLFALPTEFYDIVYDDVEHYQHQLWLPFFAFPTEWYDIRY